MTYEWKFPVGEIVAFQTSTNGVLIPAKVVNCSSFLAEIEFAYGNRLEVGFGCLSPAPTWMQNEYRRMAEEIRTGRLGKL